MTITILAAAYQEEEVIGPFVGAMAGVLGDGDELLIVDDGSTDATPTLLARLSGEHAALRVITHERNRGLGAALATGFAAATGDVVVTMDSDLSHPADLVPALVAACESADAAYASRFVAGGGMEGVPAMRAWISRVSNAVARFLLRVPVRDMTTGFRAYQRQALEALSLRGTGFEAQLEITVRLVDRGARIEELPLMLRTRAAGESKLRYLPLLVPYSGMAIRMAALRWLGIGRKGRR